MKPFFHALVAGLLVAGAKYWLLANELTQWDLTLVSISGLIAGIFFTLTMTFRSTLQDYKKADITLGDIRGVILSLNDLNTTAKLNGKGHTTANMTRNLMTLTSVIRDYTNLAVPFASLQNALRELNPACHTLHDHLTPQQVNTLLSRQHELRKLTSYLSYVKDLHFPRVGYIFLYFFILILVSLQLFAHATNHMLEMLFIFSLSTVLVFFAELIRDLDEPFRKSSSSFLLDTVPLDNCIKTLEQSLANESK